MYSLDVEIITILKCCLLLIPLRCMVCNPCIILYIVYTTLFSTVVLVSALIIIYAPQLHGSIPVIAILTYFLHCNVSLRVLLFFLDGYHSNISLSSCILTHIQHVHTLYKDLLFHCSLLFLYSFIFPHSL